MNSNIDSNLDSHIDNDMMSNDMNSITNTVIRPKKLLSEYFLPLNKSKGI